MPPSQNSPTHDAFIEAVTNVTRKLRTRFDAMAKSRGLTFSRARLFVLLARHEGASQAELADLLEVEQPSMVRLVDGLEKCGLIERQAGEEDRRSKHIYLTEAGREKAGEILPFARELKATVLEGIDAEELRQATLTLQKVAANIAAQS
ncbi:MarR family winged helix-turn-helix transcriptional regulator [Afifella marina]|uniref:MarR family transcriptional regulator, transcriptional regulator for hemolysin n=1 Tax=Afifella marina DSM 2698 TaxID=1120955 RepID=A0A1G5N1D6_AFIMA|nr:MarR family transcriptional regulator [Afifella marina]MBK1622302.1 MarR family transcriptional regulator [Afifella marina DSM 2698]MBK1626984.1 MarR family transcriptional regulator [Afifella marina]MBK5919086.1 hypothetical protein [Afifella marina]RAI20180.1 hypothetical protein CH311_10140 [Afifella marina DSM 2698]SCZ31172.1 MarR family transcriptional regulator, transcriptional regulator for hemolysin [Afifella marina DSM 2698]